MVLILFISCIEEPTEKFEIPQQHPKLAIVKDWFETNKEQLRIDDSRENFSLGGQELILPFFEKEPDWDKFHIYEWPDGRIVYEINLANKEMVLSSEFKENMPQANPQETVIQNIMFVENRENGRYDPVIARYYPADEYSISDFDDISYNQIGAGWSGKVDLWTYDERYFIGFVIEDGVIVSTAHPHWYMDDQNARKLPNSEEITLTTCVLRQTVIATTVSTSTGSTTTYHVESSIWYCPSGGGGDSIGSSYTVGGGSTYEWPSESWSGGGGSGSSGTVSGSTYTPPVIRMPSVLNALNNPCASRLFIQSTKNNNFNFTVPAQIGNLNPAIINLFQQTTKYPYLIKNGSVMNINRQMINARTTLNSGIITVEINDSYLNQATELSIVRTIIHENVHAYLLHQSKTNVEFAVGLNNFAKQNNLNNLPNTHHELMGQYVLGMAISLWNWDKNFGETKGALDFEYYYAMAFGGLLDYDTKKPNQAFQTLAGTKVADYLKIIENESSGNSNAKGKKCNQ
ncbi:hypothetical protein CLW00_105163 [Mongoliibacter ruber]|uniref:SprT-like family protein n=1 Tax=Mongoliibacter ruber TaxID=1750599 RepID=A0A2T0WMZ3_9BACT|nr:hypothetical protein CLW00_105163 [Mongoliibacter ruber]